jgi:xylulokinase
VGLTVGHDLRHLTRAVMEGVAFGLRDGLDLMTEAGVPKPDSIRASGGGIRSELWRQILADVLEARIDTVATEEGAAYGAALLASVGAGQHSSVDAAVAQMVTARPAASPSDLVDSYRRAHERYQALYPALRPTFHAIP